MYFDGAARQEGAGAGVVFITAQQDMLPYSFTLSQRCSNNVAEYQALILGLESISKVSIKHVPRKMNKQVDALAGLASSIAYPRKEVSILLCEKWVIPPIFEPQEYETKDEEEAMATTVVDGIPDDWRLPFVDYFQYGRLPDDLK
ncbi:hypothetical protein LIER_15991 [Lithospermum erythrorhizon]|uniref:RNase H type-1 domain-containing protein n=1 Tax=Lithospermum erythrorhizon TaxID=34254 RepID=A0AAV3Q858_LITER